MKRTGVSVPAAAIGLVTECPNNNSPSLTAAADAGFDDPEAIQTLDDVEAVLAAMMEEEEVVDEPPQPAAGTTAAAVRTNSAAGDIGPSTTEEAALAASGGATATEAAAASMLLAMAPASGPSAEPVLKSCPVKVQPAAPQIGKNKKRILAMTINPAAAAAAEKSSMPTLELSTTAMAPSAADHPVAAAKAAQPTSCAKASGESDKPGTATLVVLEGATATAKPSFKPLHQRIITKTPVTAAVVAQAPPKAATKSASKTEKPAKSVKAGEKTENALDKLPSKPRIKTAQSFFHDAHKAQLKEEEPDLTTEEVKTRMAELYQGLSDADRRTYEIKEKETENKAKEWEAAYPNADQKRGRGGDRASEKKAAGPKFKSAYLIFCEAKRPGMKQDHPGMSFGELGKALGDVWRSATPKEKAYFEAQAKEHKEKAEKEFAANGGATAAAKPHAPKRAKVNKPAVLPSSRGEDLELGEADGSASCSGSEAAKGSFAAQDAGCLEAIDADGDEEVPTIKPKAKVKAPTASRKRARASKGRRGVKCGAGSGNADAPQPATAAPEEVETSDDEVDWEAHPAEMIVAHTVGPNGGKYMVRRQGVDFSQCGRVSQREVKRQRLDGPDGSCPVSIDLVDEYEAFQRSFISSYRERLDGNGLDLDDLHEGSPLEMCSYLGVLLEPNEMLSKAAVDKKLKGHSMASVDRMMLSLAVQRIIFAERRTAEAKYKAMEMKLMQRIEKLEAASG